jgi:hypothetical protein
MYEMFEKKTKDFIIEQYKDAERFCETPEEVLNTRAIAYGALQFSINYLFPTFNKELGDWWQNIMWEKFNQLALDKMNEMPYNGITKRKVR